MREEDGEVVASCTPAGARSQALQKGSARGTAQADGAGALHCQTFMKIIEPSQKKIESLLLGVFFLFFWFFTTRDDVMCVYSLRRFRTVYGELKGCTR